jgi:formylglycine-generating enzyme required for sulfatase activity
VTLTEAYAYVYRRVKRLAKERKKKDQEPVFSGSLAGEIALSFPGKPKTSRMLSRKMLSFDTAKQEPQQRREPLSEQSPQQRQASKSLLRRAGERKVERFRGLDWAMRWIPAGSFWMGSQGEADEQPKRCVSITRGYWMLETEVTQRQFAAFTGRWPSQFRDCKNKNCPVERVSWNQAAYFSNLLSKQQRLPRCFVCDQKTGQCRGVLDYVGCKGWRLPTEAEWEYAAHAQEANRSCRDLQEVAQTAPNLEDQAWFGRNSGVRKGGGEVGDCTNKLRNPPNLRCGTHPVAEKGANFWGVYDILGNVSEWVYDTYKENAYRTTRPVDPMIRGSSLQRIHRGGSWRSPAKEATKTYRQSGAVGWRSSFVGFRLVRLE